MLRDLVDAYEAAFPGRILGYYLLGSYAEGTPIPLSDVDVAIVFKRDLEPDEQAQAEALARTLAQSFPRRLDIGCSGEDGLSAGHVTVLKLGSRHIYGEDIRCRLHLPPLEEYRRLVTWGPYHLLARVIRGVDLLDYPLHYPDPTGEFFGYDQVRVPSWYPPGTTHGLKEWCTAICRTATAFLALTAGTYVAGKEQAVTEYRRCIGGQWAAFVDEVYRLSKVEWSYLMPAGLQDRTVLRALCRRSLDFENHYFGLYRQFLLDRLRSADPAHQCFALERLEAVAYRDPEMREALRHCQDSENAEVCAATIRVFERWDPQETQ